MDTSVINELVAHGRTDAEIAEFLGADSAAFNSFDTVERAIDEARIDPRSARLIGKHCRVCALGERPGETPAPANLQAAGRNLLELTLV
jgi:glutamine phosphoribosylpyrophosphate amidotransferase